MWRMTYNNINGAACSARGIAHRETKEELEALAKTLEGKIEFIKIHKVTEPKKETNERR